MFNPKVMKNDLIKKIKGALFVTETISEPLKCFFRIRRRYMYNEIYMEYQLHVKSNYIKHHCNEGL